MIHIYCARENIDKDAFLFDLIQARLRHTRWGGGLPSSLVDIPQRGVSPNTSAIRRVVLVVPEQSTLNTEQSAFHYIDAPGFIDLDIVSTSSLGRRVFGDVGGGKFSLINKYGKYMLFAKLLREHNDELSVYKDLQRSPKIAEKLNDMISELKQFGVSAHNLAEIAEGRKQDSILTKKLKDVALLYRGYEEALGQGLDCRASLAMTDDDNSSVIASTMSTHSTGSAAVDCIAAKAVQSSQDTYQQFAFANWVRGSKQSSAMTSDDNSSVIASEAKQSSARIIDTADNLARLTVAIPRSKFIGESEVWIYGYDYMSPAMSELLMAIASTSPQLNVILTADAEDNFFELTNTLADGLVSKAKERGIDAEVTQVTDERYVRRLPGNIALIESALFAQRKGWIAGQARNDKGLTVCIGDLVANDKDLAMDTEDLVANDKDLAVDTEDLVTNDKDLVIPGLTRDPVILVQAANVYAEAETAAVKITELLRDHAYKFEDILVLCNDMQTAVPQIRRVFEEYGLPVFVDQRKAIEHDPAVEYILALPEIVYSGWKYEDVFRFLRTGLAGIDVGEIEELENYVLKYEIRGESRWAQDFTFGLDSSAKIRHAELGSASLTNVTAEILKQVQDDNKQVRDDNEQVQDDNMVGCEIARNGYYTARELTSINQTRASVYELISAFAKGYKRGMTCGERTENLIRFLIETSKLPERIQEFADELEANGEIEYAALASASWKMVEEVSGQLRSVLSDVKVTHEEYALMLRMGFEHVKMGILPANKDSIIIGTSQRTRSGNAKAVFVLCANDGIFPAYSQDEGLLSDEEKERLEASGNFIGRSDETKLMEEQISIYRNFAKPSELLYISYSMADSEGGDIRPAPIVANLRKLFPDLVLGKDIASQDLAGDDGNVCGEVLSVVQSASGAIPHMTNVILEVAAQKKPVPKIWSDVWLRLRKDDVTGARLAQIERGLLFGNRREYIGEASIRELLNPPVIARSEATKQSSAEPKNAKGTFPEGVCPHTATIITSPSALEKYSRCPFSWFVSRGLRLTEREKAGLTPINIGNIYHNTLMSYGRELTKSGAPNSPGSLWATITDTESKEKISALADIEIAKALEESDLLPGYSRYKMQRIAEVTSEVAWAVTEQVRAGQVSDMLFEAGFETSGIFPPISAYKDGKEAVEISGRIDRVDILNDKYALITDYKSGSDTFSEPDIRSGWQLQLMLYLEAASAKYKPAGVNYFRVKEPHIADPMGEIGDIDVALAKEFKGSGKVIDTEEVAGALGVKISKVTAPEFEELITHTSKTVTELCKSMSAGVIDVKPKKKAGASAVTACTYCAYKGICGYVK